METAARLIVEQGFIPLGSKQLARATGSSKALVYNYFSTHYDLYNALLQRELSGLTASGLDIAAGVKDLDQASLLCAMLYFEHVAQRGPLLHILVTDRYMDGHIDPAVTSLLEAMRQKFVRLARKALPLSTSEIHAAIEMIATIPEEAGNLVFHKELDVAAARKVCRSLVLSGLNGLRAPDSAIFGVEDVPRST
jgi:AcrR family transcriptional regulator